MDSYTYTYLFLSIFLGVAILFALLPILLAQFIAPKRPSAIKNASYECGVQSKGDPWVQFKAQYYIYAIVFVIFDIEVLFVYPWAVVFKSGGLALFIEMLIFLAILTGGLIYAWKKGVLEWQ